MPRSGLCSVHCMEAKIHASLFNLIKKQYAMCRLKVCSNICVCVCVCVPACVCGLFHTCGCTYINACVYICKYMDYVHMSMSTIVD